MTIRKQETLQIYHGHAESVSGMETRILTIYTSNRSGG